MNPSAMLALVSEIRRHPTFLSYSSEYTHPDPRICELAATTFLSCLLFASINKEIYDAGSAPPSPTLSADLLLHLTHVIAGARLNDL
jgi:hypothetical protein